MGKVVFLIISFLTVSLSANFNKWDKEPNNNDVILFKFDSDFSENYYVITTYNKKDKKKLMCLFNGWYHVNEIKNFSPYFNGYFIHQTRLSMEYLKALDNIYGDFNAD